MPMYEAKDLMITAVIKPAGFNIPHSAIGQFINLLFRAPYILTNMVHCWEPSIR